jgi:hypothetical protein
MRTNGQPKALKLKRQLEITQKILLRSLFTARESPLNDRHFRSMRRRLASVKSS